MHNMRAGICFLRSEAAGETQAAADDGGGGLLWADAEQSGQQACDEHRIEMNRDEVEQEASGSGTAGSG